MTAPVIRRATADDLGRTREAPGDPCYAAAFAAIVADPNQFLAVVEDEGTWSAACS